MTFIKRAVPHRRDIGLAQFVEDELKRMLGAQQRRGEGGAEEQVALAQLLAGAPRLINAKRRQIWVLPPREKILGVPFALAVTDKYECSIHA